METINKNRLHRECFGEKHFLEIGGIIIRHPFKEIIESLDALIKASPGQWWMDFGWCGEDGLSKKIQDKSSKSIFSIRFNIFMAEALGKPSSWISGNPAFLRSFPAASWAASCSPSKLASESEPSSFSGFLSAFVLPAGVISCSKQNMYSEIRRGIFQKYYCILWFYIYIFLPFRSKACSCSFHLWGGSRCRCRRRTKRRSRAGGLGIRLLIILLIFNLCIPGPPWAIKVS